MTRTLLHGTGGWLPSRSARRAQKGAGVNVEVEPREIAVIQSASRDGNGPETRSVRIAFNSPDGAIYVDFGVPDLPLLIAELADAQRWLTESERPPRLSVCPSREKTR